MVKNPTAKLSATRETVELRPERTAFEATLLELLLDAVFLMLEQLVPRQPAEQPLQGHAINDLVPGPPGDHPQEVTFPTTLDSNWRPAQWQDSGGARWPGR